MSGNFRHRLIAFVTFLGGIYFFAEFMLPEVFWGIEIAKYHDEISLGVQAIGVMAIGLGLINILRVHGGNFLRLKKGWVNSLALLLGMALMLGAQGREIFVNEKLALGVLETQGYGLYLKKLSPAGQPLTSEQLKPLADKLRERLSALENFGRVDSDFYRALKKAYELVSVDARAAADATALFAAVEALPRLAQAEALATGEEDLAHKLSKLLQEGFFVPLGSAMFALLAFYIASAAYRSFRVRSGEALVMMLAALLVILGQIPFGPLYISERLPDIRLWLIENVSTPAFRAIFFGSSVAGLVMAVRMWLSLERNPLMTEDELSAGDQS